MKKFTLMFASALIISSGAFAQQSNDTKTKEKPKTETKGEKKDAKKGDSKGSKPTENSGTSKKNETTPTGGKK